MEDKFILMGLNDENSKSIAEVLQNKTCKKILDLLADSKELSEKDISGKLNMPINTVEYNLNKLIKSGLVEKTKNYFWSVKGKKIPMYKLVRKHIIISPYKNPTLDRVKGLFYSLIGGIFGLGLVYYFNRPKVYFEDNIAFAEPMSLSRDNLVSNQEFIGNFNFWLYFAGFFLGMLFIYLIYLLFKKLKYNWMKGGA